MSKHINRKAYLSALFGGRDAVLDDILRRSLLEDRFDPIQIDYAAGRILQLLTLLHKPERVVEIGTLFGYSTVHIARGLSTSGRITGLEIDPRAADAARRNLDAAGLSHRAEILNLNALDYLDSQPDGCFDMAFIDGEKREYPAYMKALARKLRTGALLIADDAFADGAYASDDKKSEREAASIHTYNKAVAGSAQFFSAIVPTETGLMVSLRL